MHDAHLGHVFLFLDILAEYTRLSITVMVTPCLWYIVGMKLVMSYVKFPQAPFARAPLANVDFWGESAGLGFGPPQCPDVFKDMLLWALLRRRGNPKAVFSPQGSLECLKS